MIMTMATSSRGRKQEMGRRKFRFGFFSFQVINSFIELQSLKSKSVLKEGERRKGATDILSRFVSSQKKI
jgi:hypothetical protein